MTESNRIEYKRQLTEKLEKEVVAFLNYQDGGIPCGVSEDYFFNGYSSPRNKEIMRVFRDLEIVEQLGSGVPRILERYGRDVFEIRPNTLRVIFRFETASVKTPVKTPVKTLVKTLVKTPDLILTQLKTSPELTLAEVVTAIGKSLSAVERASSKLVKLGRLRHVGPQKGGHWQVIEEASS